MLEFCEITGLDRWFLLNRGLKLTCQAYPESFLNFKKHFGHASHTREPVLCWSRINKKERGKYEKTKKQNICERIGDRGLC